MSKHPVILSIAIGVLAIVGGLYFLLLPGLSVARQAPSALETQIATYLLRHSVPESAKRAVSPLGKDAANVTAATKSPAGGRIELVGGKLVLEASGGITLDTAAKVAETGVDYLSSGAITQSAPSLDVALDIET